jgi:hypothetical protein
MSKPNRRPLRYEALEVRNLFSVDGLVPHNFISPEDCDNSGDVTPLDALVVINELNRPEANVVLDESKMLDVDADGSLSPLDALVIINHLNNESTDGIPVVSSVPIAKRIVRLENAINHAALPVAMTVDEAQEVLSTLRAGGRPELGERVIDGKLHPKVEVDQIDNERAACDLTKPVSDGQISEGEQTTRLQRFLDRFAARLKSAGVDAQVITTITDEIKAGIENKAPLTFEQIKTRLTELGVDVSKIFPAPPTTTPPNHGHPELEHRLAGLIERLKAAGVTVDVVNTIVGEIKASIDAGTPLTLDQIKARLTELGVDLTKLFPPEQPPKDPPVRPVLTPPVAFVTAILQRANVPAATIEIVRKAMVAAKEAGAPLTVSQVLTLLKENGVNIPDRLLRMFGRR